MPIQTEPRVSVQFFSADSGRLEHTIIDGFPNLGKGNSLGQFLHDYRISRLITQKALAGESGISQITISFTEVSKYPSTTISTVEKMARGLGLETEFGGQSRIVNYRNKGMCTALYSAETGELETMISPSLEGFGDFLRKYRGKKGILQTDLAGESGISQVTISFIENAHSMPMGLTTAYIVDGLGLVPGLSVQQFPDKDYMEAHKLFQPAIKEVQKQIKKDNGLTLQGRKQLLEEGDWIPYLTAVVVDAYGLIHSENLPEEFR